MHIFWDIIDHLSPAQKWVYGLTIGAISILIGHWVGQRINHALSVIRERSNKTISAKNKLRSAFAPAQARIKITDEDSSAICNFIGSFLSDHAAAVEEFRHFVPKRRRDAYQKAWDEYHRTATQTPPVTRGEAWGRNLKIRQLFEEKIQGILSFTENE